MGKQREGIARAQQKQRKRTAPSEPYFRDVRVSVCWTSACCLLDEAIIFGRRGCLFVCPGATGQTAGRSAMKLGMLKLLVTGHDGIPRNPDSISRFPGNGKKSIFEATVPTLGAIFS